MSVLYFLEGIRTPFLNYIMYAITQCGDETVFLVLALWLFWCVDKKKGYYLLTVGFWGLEINQLLKMIFRIPRPWVLDPNFTIVEMARKGAGGYSFPSGHTQIATGVFGCIAATEKKKGKIVGILLIVLVALSRMYLGVHTPRDVTVSLLVGIILVLFLYPFFFSENPGSFQRMSYLFTAMVLFSAVVGIYIFRLTPEIVDADNLADAEKTVSTVFGALAAVIAGYYLEEKYVGFETKAPVQLQIVKFIAGLILVLGIKSGLKAAFRATLIPTNICDMLRYAVVVLFIILIWPMIFMKFTAAIGQEKNVSPS